MVPPNIHRRNAAERAIRTFKAHFLSGLATCDPNFPISEWDRLLPQAEMTLNMLRTSRIHPKLSAYAYIAGPHDFNKNPLAPPGTKVIIHKKPGVRNTWGYHGKQGWYVGPAMNHYRCFTCFVPSTAKEVVTDTVKFIPKKIPFPELNLNMYLQLAIEKIIQLLENDQYGQLKTNQFDILNSFKNVATILQRKETPPQFAQKPRVQSSLHDLLHAIKHSKHPHSEYQTAAFPRVIHPSPTVNTFYNLPVQAFLRNRPVHQFSIPPKKSHHLPIHPQHFFPLRSENF